MPNKEELQDDFRGTDDYLIKEYNRTRNKNAIDNWIHLGGIGSNVERFMYF